MSVRIDNLTPGTDVLLKFHGSRSLGNDGYTEVFTFEGIEGTGDDRRASFGDWEAYRYNGHWAYGTSAERLSVVEIV